VVQTSSGAIVTYSFGTLKDALSIPPRCWMQNYHDIGSTVGYKHTLIRRFGPVAHYVSKKGLIYGRKGSGFGPLLGWV